MNDCTLQRDNLFHQLTLNGALTDALLMLYNTNKSDNEYVNKFLQLCKLYFKSCINLPKPQLF
jgi:hypothetical protein